MTSVTRISTCRHAGHRLPGSACWIVAAVVALALAAPAGAISILKSFAGGALDGANPEASLILDGSGNLYGTTTQCGASNVGTLFALKTDGTGFTILHTFAGGASDGAGPEASVILDSAGNLYGTTQGGGASGNGTVFKVKTDGTGFTLLHSFVGSVPDGANPHASLILDSAGNLYGTTPGGGASGNGNVFKLKTDGTGFTVLHNFAGGATDGANPHASLILDSAGNLYGTTENGGALNDGTVFTLKTNGTSFTLLHSFAGYPSDGALPSASLILDGAGNLYGTTYAGCARGTACMGTVFTVRTDGTGFTLLHSFAGGALDGSNPKASLILDGSGNLYGTTVLGGAWNCCSGGPCGFGAVWCSGTVFTLKTDGMGFTVLHGFALDGSEGTNPYASLILDSAGNLYGTTSGWGASNLGTVFSLPVTGDQAPAITSANSVTFTVGVAGSFTVTTTGYPTGASMAISETGALPSSLTFTDNHDGTATLAGTPAAGTAGSYPLTITAHNGVGSDAIQNFTLTVVQNCYTLSTATNPVGVGSVTVNTAPNCGGNYASGTAISLTANVPSGYTFSGWSGSGGTFSSTSANPTTFTISGTASVTATITGGPAPAYSIWVPVASHNSGKNNSQWRSDLGLLNAGTVTANVQITLFGSGGPSNSARISPGVQLILSDVVGQLGASGSAALEIVSDQALGVTARTYNQVSSTASCYPNGTQGQDYPVVVESDGLVAGQSAYLAGLAEDASFRCNIGLVHIGSRGATVLVELFDGAGTKLTDYTVNLNPGEWKQETQPFFYKAGQTAMDRGYARITVQSGAGVFGFASVIDNITNDPTTATMQRELGAQFTQQGSKLVGSGAFGHAAQGSSVAISADGNTAIVGGPDDYCTGPGGCYGAVWVFTRSNGIWAQQGGKLVASYGLGLGTSVAISEDGNTFIVGVLGGAAWVYTRSGGVWAQQDSQLVASAVTPWTAESVAISGDGNTAIVGEPADESSWVFTRTGGVWSQQGTKLVGTDGVGAGQGFSVAISADGNTAIVGGPSDSPSGAAWVFSASTHVVWVPVASHNSGKNNSQWQSDLGLLNPGTVTANVQIEFYGSSGVVSSTATVPAGAQSILTDVVGGLGASGSGAIEVLSDQPFEVTARTYNEVSAGASCYANGTQGQDYPAVAAGGGLSAGQSAYLAGLSENASYRCNIGQVNTSTGSATVLVELYDGAGTKLTGYTVWLAAGEWWQETQPFFYKAGQTAMDRGYAKITVQAGTGVFGFASVIDNLTNDPTTVAMER